MYAEHFGLAQLPFTITPDTHFLYAHPSYLDALNTLVVAVRSGEGFIKVVGEVGTGKTLLCRKLLNVLDGEGYVTAYVPNPYLEPMTLLLAIADELGVAYEPNANQHLLLKLLTNFLINAHRDRKRVVLCLDEAQAMPVETLETLRLLSNLETEQSKLLQVVLFGQPELDAKLDDPAIRQLKQRIAFSCNLKPISNDDVERYVSYRLEVAGYHGPRLFARDSVRLLHRASRGVPRLINILAHKAMMAGYGEGAHYITDRYVKLAIADTETTRARLALRRRRWFTLAGAVAAVALVSGGALFWGH